MPRYWPIKQSFEGSERKRVLERLLELRQVLDQQIAVKQDNSLLLATWNLRDFDSNKFKHGPRLKESFHYIAEIISHFDLVAIQEVNRDLIALQKLVHLLGPEWRYLVTGVTEGPSGNDERMAFVYNGNRVRFTSLAGQVVLAQSLLVSATGKAADGVQFARAPYVASFQAGWFKFNLCTVHIFYGKETGPALQRRIDEIRSIAAYYTRLQAKEPADYILLGDFNIVSPQHQTMEALQKNGFRIPDPLKKATNLGKNKFYDQIAFKHHDKRLELGRAGVFDFRDAVFRDSDFDAYYPYMPTEFRDYHVRGKNKGKKRSLQEKRDYYNKDWITWQMSDHLLMWVELKVDFTNDYLKSLMPGADPLAVPPE